MLKDLMEKIMKGNYYNAMNHNSVTAQEAIRAFFNWTSLDELS